MNTSLYKDNNNQSKISISIDARQIELLSSKPAEPAVPGDAASSGKAPEDDMPF